MADYIATYRVGAGLTVRKPLTAGNWYRAKVKAVELGFDLEREGTFSPGWAVVEVEETKEKATAPVKCGKKKSYLAVYDYGYGVRSTRPIEAHSLDEAKGIALHDEDTRRWLVSVVRKHPEGDGVSRR